MIYLEQKIEVYRLNIYSKSEEYEKSGEFLGLILPVKAEDVMLTEGDPAKQFKLIADIGADLKEADKVVCEGEKYIVKIIRKYRLRSLERIEAYIYKPNN